jgi:toluene monooxygenase system ferredoxin subunit
VRVAKVDDVWVGDLVGVEAAGVPVVLVNVDGTIRAYRDRCAHLRVRLSEGRLDGSVLTCRAHQWQYDAVTGSGINPRDASLEPLAVEIRADAVFVRLDGRDD